MARWRAVTDVACGDAGLRVEMTQLLSRSRVTAEDLAERIRSNPKVGSRT